MRSNVSLKHHQNINLKVIITFSNFKILPFMVLIKGNRF